MTELDKKYSNLSLKLELINISTKKEIKKKCKEKYQPKITTELSTLDTSITQKCNLYTTNEITSLRNFMVQELSKYQPKITTDEVQ